MCQNKHGTTSQFKNLSGKHFNQISTCLHRSASASASCLALACEASCSSNCNCCSRHVSVSVSAWFSKSWGERTANRSQWHTWVQVINTQHNVYIPFEHTIWQSQHRTCISIRSVCSCPCSFWISSRCISFSCRRSSSSIVTAPLPSSESRPDPSFRLLINFSLD